MTQPLMDRIRERRGSKVGPLSRLPERRITCRECGQRSHHRLTYVHPEQRNPQGSSLFEIVVGVVVLLLLFGAVFIAFPIIVEVIES